MPPLISVASKQPGLNTVLNTIWTTQRETWTPQVRGSPCPSVAVGVGAGPQGKAPRPPWHLDYMIELLIKFILIASDAIFCVILASPTVSPLKVGLLLSCTSSVSIPSEKSFTA